MLDKSETYLTKLMHVIRNYGDDFVLSLTNLPSRRFVIEFARRVQEDKNVPHPPRCDFEKFQNTLNNLLSNKDMNIIIVANHPDFLTCEIQNPLWFIELIGGINKAESDDPFVFISETVIPRVVGEVYNHLLVVERDNPHVIENLDILRKAEKLMSSDGRKIFFIFPEGVNAENDVMVKAREGGLSILLNTAMLHYKEVAILPIGLAQELVSRDGVDRDQYHIFTGEPILIENNSSINTRVRPSDRFDGLIDNVMNRIANLVPSEKRGYYNRLN